GFQPLPTMARTLPTEEPALRNEYTGTTNVYETEHFAIWWGSSFFDVDSIDSLGEAFELGWDEALAMGYPTPTGTDMYKFNVYIGDTGGPSSYGASGYFYYDPEDWPMVVIDSDIVGTDTGLTTAVHEYFHAIQDGVQTYQYSDIAAWYFESTAMWFESLLYAETAEFAHFLYAFAFLPELPLNYFNYPETMSTDEYHHYGTFVFISHLEEHYGRELIRRSWMEAPRQGDPLETLDKLLKEQGANIVDTFFSFAVRNATWDYEYESLYEEHLESKGGWDNTDSHRPTGYIRVPTVIALLPPGHPPHTYGSNYWKIVGLDETFYVSFSGDIRPSEWYVAVATQEGDVHTTYEVPLKGAKGSLEVNLVDADEAWLVVSVAEGSEDVGAWSYEVAATFYEPIHDAEPRACGCTMSSRKNGGDNRQMAWWPLLITLAASQRRRWRNR
ncbi:MAG: hypothetical protein HN348_11615, partial [Proteobacteria bacterium]|nr:hypothetical protein [Pseudomonadota bacterium]